MIDAAVVATCFKHIMQKGRLQSNKYRYYKHIVMTAVRCTDARHTATSRWFNSLNKNAGRRRPCPANSAGNNEPLWNSLMNWWARQPVNPQVKDTGSLILFTVYSCLQHVCVHTHTQPHTHQDASSSGCTGGCDCFRFMASFSSSLFPSKLHSVWCYCKLSSDESPPLY